MYRDHRRAGPAAPALPQPGCPRRSDAVAHRQPSASRGHLRAASHTASLGAPSQGHPGTCALPGHGRGTCPDAMNACGPVRWARHCVDPGHAPTGTMHRRAVLAARTRHHAVRRCAVPTRAVSARQAERQPGTSARAAPSRLRTYAEPPRSSAHSHRDSIPMACRTIHAVPALGASPSHAPSQSYACLGHEHQTHWHSRPGLPTVHTHAAGRAAYPHPRPRRATYPVGPGYPHASLAHHQLGPPASQGARAPHRVLHQLPARFDDHLAARR